MQRMGVARKKRKNTQAGNGQRAEKKKEKGKKVKERKKWEAMGKGLDLQHCAET